MCFGNLSPMASRTSTSVLPTRSWAAREPAEVGHSLKIPDDDAWFHAVPEIAFLISSDIMASRISPLIVSRSRSVIASRSIRDQ
jgi:hypothetical protein